MKHISNLLKYLSAHSLLHCVFFSNFRSFQGVEGHYKHPVEWKFQGGGGPRGKTPPWGEYGYFMEPHTVVCILYRPFLHTSRLQAYLASEVKVKLQRTRLLLFTSRSSKDGRNPNPQFIVGVL